MRWMSLSEGRSEDCTACPPWDGGASLGLGAGGAAFGGGAAAATAIISAEAAETVRTRRRFLHSRDAFTGKSPRRTCQHPSFSPMLPATYQPGVLAGFS